MPTVRFGSDVGQAELVKRKAALEQAGSELSAANSPLLVLRGQRKDLLAEQRTKQGVCGGAVNIFGDECVRHITYLDHATLFQNIITFCIGY